MVVENLIKYQTTQKVIICKHKVSQRIKQNKRNQNHQRHHESVSYLGLSMHENMYMRILNSKYDCIKNQHQLLHNYLIVRGVI